MWHTFLCQKEVRLLISKDCPILDYTGLKKKEISVILRLNDYRVKGDGPRELKLEIRTVAWFFAGISEKWRKVSANEWGTEWNRKSL